MQCDKHEILRMFKFRQYIGFIHIFFFVFALILLSCNRSKNSGGDNPWAELDDFDKSDTSIQELNVAAETMVDVIENISSPVEMAALILDLGIPYSNDYLASTDNVDQYNTAYKKAINLGVFGADLGYLNMYNKTNVVMDYISAIKDLSDGIKVGQFFDFTTLKRLVTNNTNLDSLMLISQQNFNKMDQYLRENNRSNLSTLIITGVWVEGIYLVTQVAKDNPHAKIRDAIGDQKTIVPIILGLLNNYRKDPFFKKLSDDFTDLKNIFDEVNITIEIGDPQPIEVDGYLIFESAEKSIINISDETLNKIIAKSEEIRNNLIKL